MKIIKLITSIIMLNIILFIGLLNAEVLEIETKVITSGTQESFAITVNNSPNVVKSFGFDIKFCPDYLNYDGYNEGSLIQKQYSFFMVKYIQSESLIRVGMVCSKNKQIDIAATGVLLKLNFTALQEGGCELTIINKYDDIKNWSVKNGWFHSSNPPVAQNNSFSIDEDSLLTDTLTSLNPNNLTLTYRLLSSTSKGTITITNDSSGAFTYTPYQNENGTDHFQFVVNDGTIDSVPADVTINIAAINDPPILSSIIDQYVYESTSSPITCTVEDPDDPLSKILISVKSSDQRIIPNDSQHVIVKGSGSIRTIYLSPAVKSFGKSIITVKAVDPNQASVETRFTVISDHMTHSIVSQAYTNGTIDPIGTNTVNKDDDLVLNITPDDGYEIDEVWIDSDRLWNTTPVYTFWKVSQDHTITATFKEAEYYTISTAVVPSEAGSISPSKIVLTKGKNQLVKININAGYLLDDVFIDGISQGNISYHVFSNISDSHHITANYSAALPPVANFSSSNLNGSIPFQVNFYDNSQNTISNWNWDFGDGGTSKNPNPIHTYVSPGSYTVSLNVTGPGGTNTSVKTNYITVDNLCRPTMDFSINNRIINKGESISLTPVSIDGNSSIEWNLGDGSFSNILNPEHIYTEAGYYTVTLTTSFDTCSETKTKANYIIVNGRQIYGQVLPALSGCIIEIWHNKNLIASTTTDQTGNYVVDNLPVRKGFIVSINPPTGNKSYLSQYYDGTSNGVNNPENAMKISTISNDAQINFTLEAIPDIGICGSVFDENNNPMSSINITVFSETGSLAKGQTDANGSYNISGLISANNYIVFAWSDIHQQEFFYAVPDGQSPGAYHPTYSVFSKDTATKITPSNPCIQKIDLVLKSESIYGRVLTESGQPVASAKVNAWSNGFKTGNFTLSDESGYYTITGLTPISKTDDYANLGYIVEVLKSIYPYQAYNIAESRNNAIRVYTNISGIDFRLIESSTISGSITDKYKTPIPYANVCASPQNGGNETCTQSSLSGSYELSGLSFQDDYIIYAFTSAFPAQYYNQAQNYDNASPIKLTSSGVTGIDFIFDEGAVIRGEIVINGDNTIDNDIYVNLRSDSSNVDKYMKAEANGSFKFIQLDYNVSDYVISIFTDGYLPAIYNSNTTASTWAEAETVGPSDSIIRTITLSKGAIIKGTVTNLGEPEADVLIEAYSNQILEGASLSTNYLLNGYNYEISGLPSNKTYDIYVTHDSLIANPQSVTVVNEAVVNFSLTKPNFTISGQVTGIPKGKKVQITAWTLTNQTKTISLIGTGNTFKYTIYGLKPDPDYYVDIICQGFPYQIYNNKYRLSDADVIDLSTASIDNIDFTLVKQSGQITGNIKYPYGASGGESVFISAFSSLDSPLSEVSTVLDENCTLADGCDVSYLIDGIDPKKTYYVFVSSDNYKSYYYNGTLNGTIKLNEGLKVSANQSVNFYMSKGLSISGSVVDTNGEAVSGLNIEAWSSALESFGKAITDKNGLFAIYGLEDTDDYILYAVQSGIAPYFYNSNGTVRNKDSAEQINPSVTNSIVITYDEGESIKGTICDANGIRLSGIWVKAQSKSKHIQSGVFSLNDGTFEISNLPSSNDYKITAQPIHTYMPASKTNVSSATDNINFFLSSGYTVSGKVLDSSDNGISDVEISLWSKSLSYSSFDRSDSSGNYQISGIPEGNDFLLFAASYGENSYVPLKEEGFSVSSNLTKNIVLKQGFSISGNVYTDASESIPYSYGARITAFSNSADFFGDTTSDMNGYFKISNLPDASDYSLELFPSVNYANQVKNYQLAGTTVNFVLETGGTIDGSVIDSTGNIVSGARIEISSETGNIFESTSTDRNGDYGISGLKRTRFGNLITDYLIYVYADGYPPHSSVGKSVGDTVNFILSSSDANVITGVVMDSSGALPPSDVNILVRTFFQDSFNVAVKPVIVDESGVYTVTALDANKLYRFLFKAYQNGSMIFEQWADENENGVTDIESARSYATDESVNFKFNNVW